jgi:catechol 2,3-dioxygenase-like lactoylglutathione lyase family enzyme
MFQPKAVAAALPAQDFERAKRFWAERVGFSPVGATDEEARYRVGQNEFLVFPSSGKASGDHTQIAFEVDDIEAAVAALRGNGVVFEEYDTPDFKTVGGIVEMEGEKAAWFKDSEGNVVAVGQYAE